MSPPPPRSLSHIFSLVAHTLFSLLLFSMLTMPGPGLVPGRPVLLSSSGIVMATLSLPHGTRRPPVEVSDLENSDWESPGKYHVLFCQVPPALDTTASVSPGAGGIFRWLVLAQETSAIPRQSSWYTLGLPTLSSL